MTLYIGDYATLRDGAMIDVTVLFLDQSFSSTAVGPLEVFSHAGSLWNILTGSRQNPRFRVTTASANGTYSLQLKNLDTTGGLAATLDQGEVVSATDFNAIANGIGVSNAVSFWRDFDSSGSVAAADFNLISRHLGHNCATPNNP